MERVVSTHVPFLNSPYGGYFRNEVPPEDEELTHIGPGTPAGEWFRRFWFPMFASEELKDLPKAIRILGEDLVVFRDRSGRVGLLELHCSHRGTSLEFGQIEERGIRCCYHAWLYDVDGKILETPGEPAESTLKDRLCHGAYPTVEHQGLVFAYMGPADKRPAFPLYDTYNMPGYHSRARMHNPWPCNWLQVMENVHDPAHLLFLHTIYGNQGFTADLSEPAELDFIESPLGMLKFDTRRFGDLVWVRMGDFIPPALHLGPGNTDSVEERYEKGLELPALMQWSIPLDDTHTQRFDLWYGLEGKEVYAGEATYGQQAGPYEERQRMPGDYDTQVSQRPIAVHAMEHLGVTDRGVIMGRNIVRRGIRDVRDGKDPLGVIRREGAVIPTYGHGRVLRVPPAPSWEADRQLLRETGRRVVEERIRERSPR